MENTIQHSDNHDNKPEWETPELVIEFVASGTENGPALLNADGSSGS